VTAPFLSVSGERYHILIQLSGNFSLSVNTSSIELPGNDRCSNAELVDQRRNTTIFGSTAVATYDIFEDACWLTVSRDLWYKVVGNGSGMLASLCNPGTDFDSQLSIYSSLDEDGSCSSLECVITNDDACDGLASQVWWLTEQDKVYLIRVHAYNESSFGNFALQHFNRSPLMSQPEDR
jgi:hypothetical protein